ncbi:aldo/keto reductase [Candidatus Woesearchaeota archaeon]|nr:aldo/keto reductase [Candidatus Woesearchaeota archaeon]
MDINSKVNLNNNLKMPVIGLGTWQIRGKSAENSVLYALEAGYRLIDTASFYNNEEEVGNAIKKSGIPRGDLFITTKIWNSEHNDPEKAFNKSLKKLNLDYIDLYLIHWPVQERLKTWKILERLYKEGKCKAIGVSNFTINHIKELLNNSEIIPAVNQVEFSPYLYQKELLEFCKLKKIALEAYSPLTRGANLDDEKLADIARKYNKSTAQILIKWGIQHGLIVIPKSSNKDRIYENINIFDFNIAKKDMEHLDSLNDNLHYCWDPTNEL